ncbi:hypothetical protein [Frateuria sp. STR12]|uniref:hypothetical protein n=1 Tax=Frateuria hangzhouensis TaxID=2995589 RepID=UPI0022609A99|nr:hypothetical protein [Frateuria sp. STR12]MCX7515385.1 hypothetical protein [Frateuria sp. STR12]
MWPRLGAGVVPGFFLAAALVGLACWLPPGSWESWLVPGLVAFFPVWLAVACLSLRFASGPRAWLWLSGLAMLGLGLLRVLQQAGWVR